MPPLSPRSSDEFAPGASLPPGGSSRREFLRLAGATAVLAGAAGCSRPARTLVPAVLDPDRLVPDGRRTFASAIPWEGYGRGILVETRDGRPTKIEGNPAHGDSGGATDAITQAAVRDLYDPSRLSAPRGPGGVTSWPEFASAWQRVLPELLRSGGAGWALLTEPTSSPTIRRLLAEWRMRFPQARWYQHTALERWGEEGRQLDYRIGEADVIVALEADFLQRHPAALRYAREFAGRRRSSERFRPNRLYVAEAGWTITGGMADMRLPLAPSRLPPLLGVIAGGGPGDLDPASLTLARQAAADLREARATALVLGGPGLGRKLREGIAALNRQLGAADRTVVEGQAVRSDDDPASHGGAAELADAVRQGKARTLVVIGCDPAGTSGSQVDFAGALRHADLSIGLGAGETGALCHWQLPESHFLECWGDWRGFDGRLVCQQPLIDPLGQSRSAAELLQLLSTGAGTEEAGFSLVRATHRVPDETWERWLATGVGTG